MKNPLIRHWQSILAFVSLAWIVALVGLVNTAPQQRIPLTADRINHEIGCAYTTNIKTRPLAWPLTRFEGDTHSFRYSRLTLLEDGKTIGFPHALHDTIREKGLGNYNYWGKQFYFSTPDCTDPRINGKTYEALMPLSLSFPGLASCFIAAFVFFASIQKRFMHAQIILKGFSRFEKINIYYCISFLTIVIAVIYKFPALVVSPEFYAETADLFFREARESTFREVLTYVEADYLVTFPLLLSFILVRVFGVVDNFPGTINLISILFVAFSSSLINLRAFRSLVDSDLLRFMIGLSIGLLPNYDAYQLLNANLFGLMIYLLFIFVDKDQFSRTFFYFMVGVLFLIGVSRPNLVAFLPVYLVLLVNAARKNRFRDVIFYGAGTLSLGLQTFVIIMAQLFWSFRHELGIYNKVTGLDSLTVPFFIAINRYFNTLLSVIFVQVDGVSIIAVLCFTTVSLILLASYYLYRRNKKCILYFFWVSQILAFGLIYFITFSSPVTATWQQFYYFPMRWWVYSNYVMYLSLIVLAYNTVMEIVKGRKTVVYGNTASLVKYTFTLLPIVFQIYPFYRYAPPETEFRSLSNWASYRHLMQEDDYYIPVNPVQSFQWGIARDNRIIQSARDFDEKVNSFRLKETGGELKLRSFVLVNHHYYNTMKDLVVKAYDTDGKELATPKRLNDLRDRYLYYYFPDRVRPASISFFDESLNKVDIHADIHFYGSLDVGESLMLTRELQ